MGGVILLQEIIVSFISEVIPNWIDFLISVRVKENKNHGLYKIGRHGRSQSSNIQWNRVFD
jgi:hypothetical protein